MKEKREVTKQVHHSGVASNKAKKSLILPNISNSSNNNNLTIGTNNLSKSSNSSTTSNSLSSSSSTNTSPYSKNIYINPHAMMTTTPMLYNNSNHMQT